MEFELYSLKNALETINASDKEKEIWDEFIGIIKSITDEDLMKYFSIYSKNSKSLSKSIKILIEEKMISKGWEKNLPMYMNEEYRDSKRFALDFYKYGVNVEFAFNHESTCAWKLIKSSLYSTSNGLESNKDVKYSILITVDRRMRQLGGFDGSIGTYEKYIEYIKPMNEIIKMPIILVGIKPSKNFKIRHTVKVNRKIGEIKTTR